jgi:diketogulonate reductase-like aldo/keto reductase
MEFRRFGPTKFEVPVIGQGTWHLERGDRAAAIAALRLGIDLGMRHIDTAELYGWGVVERIVGEAIAGRREEVFLVSKVVPANASYSGTLAACQTSLSRLRTDWLDCYLLHWRGDYPLKETFDAFEQLQRDGKIRCWGVSNFDEADLAEAHRIAGDGHLACDQVLYHLQERAIEHAVLPWCERHNTAVVGYAPFGHGRLPGPRTNGGRVRSSGRSPVSGAPPLGVHACEGLESRARRRKRRCGSPATERTRDRHDRSGVATISVAPPSRRRSRRITTVRPPEFVA